MIIELLTNLLIIATAIFRFWAIKITMKLSKTEIIKKETYYSQYIIRDIVYYEERNPISRLFFKKPKIFFLYNLFLYLVLIFFCNLLFFFLPIDSFVLMLIFYVVLFNFSAIFIDFLYDIILYYKGKKIKKKKEFRI